MFKKLLVCLLTLTLLLSFAACGQPSDVRGDVTPNTTTETTVETTTETTTEATTEATTQRSFSIGSSTGNTYKNEFIGIQCTLDSNWIFKTDAEIQTINEVTMGLVGEEYKDILANATVIQDMMATHTNGLDSVNVVLEKLNAAALLLSEEQYLQLAKDSAVNALASMGLTIVSSDITKVQLAGNEHAALVVEANIGGYTIYEYMVVIKCNGYIACVTVATWNENTCLDVLSKFEPCA